MKNNFWFYQNISKNSGFSIVEVIIAAAIFVLLISSSAVLLFSSEDLGRINLDIEKTTLYAQEGLEVTRAIRDNDWGFLVQGDHGVSTSTGEWLFDGTSDILENKYRRSITIIDINENKKEVISSVRWFNPYGLEKNVEFTTYFTNWQKLSEEIAENIDLGDSAKDVYVVGGYAYLAVDTSHASLVIVDVFDPENPQVVYTLDLNGKGIDVWVDGNYAYIILDTNKMKVIDISSPESPFQVASVNFSAQPTSVYIYDGYAYIGQSKDNEGLVMYNVANPITPYYYKSYNLGAGAVYDVKAVNGYVYVAVNAGRGFYTIDMGNYAYAVVAIDTDNGGFETFYLYGQTIDSLAAVDIGASCNNVYYYDNNAYVACKDEEGGLKKVDVSSINSPELTNVYDVNGEGNGVFYEGSYVYVATENSEGGLSIINP